MSIYTEAVIKFGVDHQCMMCMEESSELTQALSHYLRGRDHNVEEEIADLEIMLSQMRTVFDHNKIDRIKLEKLDRLKLRIQEVR